MELHINEATIYYDVIGEGPPLLVPGWASRPRFATLAACFSTEFTVIGHDVRGAGGRTTPPPGAYTADDMADDSAALVRSLGYEKVHFLGISHTGVIGQSLAVRYPHLMDRVVLTMTTLGHVDSSSGQTPDGAPDLAVAPALAAAMTGAFGGDREAVQQLSALMLSERAVEGAPHLVDQITEQVFNPIFDQPMEDCMRFWQALSNISSTQRLDEVQAPTLVMAGSADRMVSLDDAWRMWRAIPGATLIGLPDVGHDWWVEAPERCARIVRNFLHEELDQR